MKISVRGFAGTRKEGPRRCGPSEAKTGARFETNSGDCGGRPSSEERIRR